MQIKKPHILISKCPFCNSILTGRYVIENPANDILKRYHSLKDGERIRTIYDIKIPYLNCFCEECENRWHQDLKNTWMTKEEWEQYKIEHYYEEQAYLFRKMNGNKESVINKKKELKKDRRKKIFSTSIFLLFGIKTSKIKINIDYYKKRTFLMKEYISQNIKD